jgi:hypothetical protein
VCDLDRRLATEASQPDQPASIECAEHGPVGEELLRACLPSGTNPPPVPIQESNARSDEAPAHGATSADAETPSAIDQRPAGEPAGRE